MREDKPACPYGQFGAKREAVCYLFFLVLLRLALVFPGITVGSRRNEDIRHASDRNQADIEVMWVKASGHQERLAIVWQERLTPMKGVQTLNVQPSSGAAFALVWKYEDPLTKVGSPATFWACRNRSKQSSTCLVIYTECRKRMQATHAVCAA
jgi:hypothetical protein